MSRTSWDIKDTDNQKGKIKKNKKGSRHKDQSLAMARPKLSVQHPWLQERFYKTNVFKKGTVHKRRHCSIIDCRFSLNKRSELSKQYLQQGHCQLQIIKVGPWIFTMNVESRHSKSTTKSEVPEWFLRHQSPLMQSTNHYELALWRIGCTMADA
jgi:hypothetical protein